MQRDVLTVLEAASGQPDSEQEAAGGAEVRVSQNRIGCLRSAPPLSDLLKDGTIHCEGRALIREPEAGPNKGRAGVTIAERLYRLANHRGASDTGRTGCRHRSVGSALQRTGRLRI